MPPQRHRAAATTSLFASSADRRRTPHAVHPPIEAPGRDNDKMRERYGGDRYGRAQPMRYQRAVQIAQSLPVHTAREGRFSPPPPSRAGAARPPSYSICSLSRPHAPARAAVLPAGRSDREQCAVAQSCVQDSECAECYSASHATPEVAKRDLQAQDKHSRMSPRSRPVSLSPFCSSPAILSSVLPTRLSASRQRRSEMSLPKYRRYGG